MGKVYSRSKSKAVAMAVIEEEIQGLFEEASRRADPVGPTEGPPDDGASRALTELMSDDGTQPPPEPESRIPAPEEATAWAPSRLFGWLRGLLGGVVGGRA